MYRLGIIVLSLLGSQLAFGADTPTPAKSLSDWEQSLFVSGIVANVPELKHPLPNGWQPTLYWEAPNLPFHDPVKLKSDLAELWKRGIAPRIGLEAEFGVDPKKIDQAVAQAKAVADAGLPVNIQIFGTLDLYKLDGKVLRHPEMPDMSKVKDVLDLPCVTIKDGWHRRAAHLRSLYKKFTDAKIPVVAVWFDYEGPPYPWNGQLYRTQACPSCRKIVPAEAIQNLETFKPYMYNMFLEAFDEAFGKPTREAFPKAFIGQYEFAPSTAEHQVITPGGLPLPACSNHKTTTIQGSMPSIYVWPTQLLKKSFNSDWPMPQSEVDSVYFSALVRGVSNIHYNLRPDQRLIPFVSDSVIDTLDDPKKDGPLMSDAMYRECLRHIVLRGAKGFYCFCTAPPYNPLPVYYHGLAQINFVYNELFAYPEFLEKGRVLNDAVLPPKTPGIVWSGLALPDKALIRTLALGRSTTEIVEIVPFPGVPVRLLAPPSGQTYIVERSGQVRTVD
jgi:hypothetical protein